MGPDSRVLITKARKIAQKYMLTYGEPIPANQLVREVASVMQVCDDVRWFIATHLLDTIIVRLANSTGVVYCALVLWTQLCRDARGNTHAASLSRRTCRIGIFV